ncbi:MAG: hypothetical protein LC799_19955 [Actinobacteria bacterium]|nr:hypothetical protein [Actinomycetota bacterium]
MIDLVATTDDSVPSVKIKITAKLRDIEHQRQRLTERLSETNDDLSESARLIELSLTLLENPQELYRRCDDEQRRLLNQAIFQGLYIEDDRITDHELQEPFAHLHTIQANRRLDHGDKPDPGVITSCAQDTSKATSRPKGGLAVSNADFRVVDSPQPGWVGGSALTWWDVRSMG